MKMWNNTADVDGAHISALLLRMFVMYYPFLIEAGMVYKSVPPLYSVKDGRKTKYFTENIDIVRYVQKFFLSSNEFKNLDKSELSQKDITKFFLRNSDYIYYLERLANTYAVDPYLLEIVLIHYLTNKKSIKYDKLQKEVRSAYRFMDVYKEKGTIVVRGSIEKSNLIIINDKFLSDCYDILKIIESNDNMYYLLNKKKASLYTVMKVYDMSSPKDIQRYKGLGEMGDGQLGESTLRPDADRMLIRYTLESAKESINFIREYESDTKKILSEVGLVTRDDLLD